MTEPISFRHSIRRPSQRLCVLVIHQNFGQFRHLIAALARQSTFDLLGLGRDGAPGMHRISSHKYRLRRPPSREHYPYLRQMEAAVLYGQDVVNALNETKRRGFVPEVILAHPGWGETLYAREVFPAARLIHFCEWHYDTQGDDDVGFDPNLPSWQRGGSNANEQLQLLTSYGLRADILAGYNETGIANLVRSGRGVIVAVELLESRRWRDGATAINDDAWRVRQGANAI